MRYHADKRLMALSAAGIYAGAAIISLVERVIPGGERFSIIPGIAALLFAVGVVAVQRRLPWPALAALGPAGVVMIGAAVADTRGYSDAAVLYMWPALWTAYFFGTRGTILIAAWIGIVHGVALTTMPVGHGSIDRWIDVMVAVVVVAAVVRALASHNERLVKRLASEATVDPLTGVLNRRGFDERLQVELARAIRHGSTLAVVTLDIDHFKGVNDEHGHEVGDRVLTWIGSLLETQLRASDVPARFGGEEFVILLPDTDAAGARTIADRLRAAICDESRMGRTRFGIADALQVTVSGGVAAGKAPIDLRELLDAADQAMYAAKQTGRNRVLAAGDAAVVALRSSA